MFKASEFFKSFGTEQKNKIWKILFPNFFIYGKKLVFTYSKPLDMFFNLEERPVWIPTIGKFRAHSFEALKTINRS